MFGKKIPLTAFCRGIIAAVNSAQEAISAHRQQYFLKHMDEQEDGTFKPKTMTVDLENGQSMEIPTYTMSKTNELMIERATVTGHAKIIEFDSKMCNSEVCIDGEQANFYVRPTFAGDKRTFSLRLEFATMDFMETENLLQERLNAAHQVTDKKTDT